MKIYKDYKNFKVDCPAITVGTFDGVHRGHVKILQHLKELAHKKNAESTVFTFWPHPRLILNPNNKDLRLLNSVDEKIQLLEAQGIDHLILFPFSKEFSRLKSAEFVEKILVDLLHVKHLVVGYNHHFGNDREGKYENLKDYALKYGFEVERVEAYQHNIHKVSSTEVRKALLHGEIEKATLLLDYPYKLTGTVIQGNKIGNKLGFPTANIAPQAYKLIPQIGVYAVYVDINGERYKGMLNIGIRPSVFQNQEIPTIEVHVLDFKGNLYEKKISLNFVKKLRDEQKFANIDALIAQLHKDKKQVASLLS